MIAPHYFEGARVDLPYAHLLCPSLPSCHCIHPRASQVIWSNPTKSTNYGSMVQQNALSGFPHRIPNRVVRIVFPIASSGVPSATPPRLRRQFKTPWLLLRGSKTPWLLLRGPKTPRLLRGPKTWWTRRLRGSKTPWLLLRGPKTPWLPRIASLSSSPPKRERRSRQGTPSPLLTMAR
jgi:hypothetical protein